MVHPWVWSGKKALLSVVVFAGPLMILDYYQERRADMLAILHAAPVIRWAVCGILLLFLVVSGAMNSYEFIYFQF